MKKGLENFNDGTVMRALVLFSVLFIVACAGESKHSAPPTQPTKTLSSQTRKDSSSQTVTLRQGDVKRTVTLKTRPIVDGCSMEGAMETLSSRHEYVRVCAAQYAKKHGAPPAGRIVVSMSLKKNGDIAESAVTEDPVGDSELNACLQEAIKVRFPNPYGKNCIVQAPFQFTAKAVPDSSR